MHRFTFQTAKLFASVVLGLCLLCTNTIRADDASKMQEMIKGLETKLTNCKFTGLFTVTGRELDKTTPEEYTVTSAQKLPEGDTWLLKARIKYGGTDKTVPIPLEIKWAGDTPVITMDKITIPGMGTFSARVVLHEDRYAGTWQHDNVGGHLFGTLSKDDQPAKATGGTKKP